MAIKVMVLICLTLIWLMCFKMSSASPAFWSSDTNNPSLDEECDCGENGKCQFENDEKKCTCNAGYVDKAGTCTKCDCGINGKCKFENDEKKCTCNIGYAEKEGTCTECDCGRNGKCYFEKVEKKCICDNGYTEKGETCTIGCNGEKKCQNGGICEKDGSLETCSCLEGTEGLFCEKVLACEKLDCGTDSSCTFDIKAKAAVCQCKDSKLSFDPQDKKCKKNKCKDSCGVDSDEKGSVLCEGEPFGEKNVTCKCTNETMDFFMNSKLCKVNKCKERCGLNYLENGKVLCSGEAYGETDVSCSCKDESLKFAESRKECTKEVKLSFAAIFAISFSVMVVLILFIIVAVFCRRRPRKPHYTMTFRNQTISFESAVYDANNDSMSLFETRH